MSSLVKTLFLAGCATAFSVPVCAWAQANQQCGDAITRVLNVVGGLKAGDKRADVERNFRMDGGLSFTPANRYVFKDCPYIKIDVEFSQQSKSGKYAPTDVVGHVSKPYLEYPYSD
jgi:hypothetical protein